MGELCGHKDGKTPVTVADGLKTQLGPNTYNILKDIVDCVITVEEEEVCKSSRLGLLLWCVAHSPSLSVLSAHTRTPPTPPDPPLHQNLLGKDEDLHRALRRSRHRRAPQRRVQGEVPRRGVRKRGSRPLRRQRRHRQVCGNGEVDLNTKKTATVDFLLKTRMLRNGYRPTAFP